MTSETSTARQVAGGTFHLRTKADAAVIALKHLGFTNDEIGIVAQRTAEWSDITTVGDASEILTSSPLGNQIGGLWTLGLTAVVVRGIGPVVVGGMVGTKIAMSLVATSLEGMTRALVEVGLNESNANLAFEQIVTGRTTLLVRAGHRYEDAIAIMRDYGAKGSVVG